MTPEGKHFSRFSGPTTVSAKTGQALGADAATEELWRNAADFLWAIGDHMGVSENGANIIT